MGDTDRRGQRARRKDGPGYFIFPFPVSVMYPVVAVSLCNIISPDWPLFIGVQLPLGLGNTIRYSYLSNSRGGKGFPPLLASGSHYPRPPFFFLIFLIPPILGVPSQGLLTHLEWRLFPATTLTESSEHWGMLTGREPGLLQNRLGLLGLWACCPPCIGASSCGNAGSAWEHSSRKCRDNSNVASRVELSLAPQPAVDCSFLCVPIAPVHSFLISYLQKSFLQGSP